MKTPDGYRPLRAGAGHLMLLLVVAYLLGRGQGRWTNRSRPTNSLRHNFVGCRRGSSFTSPVRRSALSRNLGPSRVVRYAVKRFALLVVLSLPCLAACGATRPGAASGVSSPVAVSSSSTATPRLSATATVSPGCWLPLFQTDAQGNSGAGSFIDIPGGAIRTAQGSELAFDQGTQRWRTATQPYLYATGPWATYDPAAGRWVPAPAEAISPDGSLYAYSEQNPHNPSTSDIRLVKVRTGNDQLLFTGPSATGYDIVGSADDGFYVVRGGPASNGLWKIDLEGNATQVTAVPLKWNHAEGGAAWAARQNPAKPMVEQGGPILDQVTRIDLPTGVITPWLTISGQDLVPIGTAAGGDPLVVSVADQAIRIWLVTAPDKSASVYSGPGRASSSAITWNGFNTVIADSGQTWVGTNQGVFQLQGTSGMVRAADVTASLAGRCVSSPR